MFPNENVDVLFREFTLVAAVVDALTAELNSDLKAADVVAFAMDGLLAPASLFCGVTIVLDLFFAGPYVNGLLCERSTDSIECGLIWVHETSSIE